VYFVSNTTLLFDGGNYNLTSSDLIIQNITNFFLNGTPNTTNAHTTSSVSVIGCLQKYHIHFYNVTNVLIKHLNFKTCGLMQHVIYRKSHAAVYFQYCSNIHIISIQISNPVVHGTIASNVKGKNSLENVTVVMNKELPYNGNRYVVHWSYDDSIDDKVIVNITNITIERSIELDGRDMKMLEFDTNRFKGFIIITIKNSNFSKLHNIDIIIKITVDSVSRSIIQFFRCHFNLNRVRHHIYVLHHHTFEHTGHIQILM